MRVISGIYKGKKLEGFSIDGTRPTMDRVKESMFGMIQNYLKNAVVLDLFAGSGALGIEALSNGSSYCHFIDNNNVAIETIKKNTFNIENKTIIKSDGKEYLNKTDLKFDVIILDPPYNIGLTNILKLIIKNNLLTDKGIIVCETEKEFEAELEVIKEKSYGKKKVVILKKYDII